MADDAHPLTPSPPCQLTVDKPPQPTILKFLIAMPEGLTFKRIGISETRLLARFLEIMGDSAKGFRYFGRRPLAVIANHLVTLLVLDSRGAPIGYGHLDPENGNIWLGVCVAEGYRGQGVGRAIVGRLLGEAVKHGVAVVTLSVDEGNTAAISLYQKFGFGLVEKKRGTCILRWEHRHSVTK